MAMYRKNDRIVDHGRVHALTTDVYFTNGLFVGETLQARMMIVCLGQKE